VLDGSNRPVDYFKLFYSDNVFAEITRLTNLNAATKRARGDKGVWTDVTVDEIKAYFGILIYGGCIPLEMFFYNGLTRI
jgi:hypothetical protein